MKEYNHDLEAQRRSGEATESMRVDAEGKRSALEQWCINSYGEVGGWVGGLGAWGGGIWGAGLPRVGAW